MRLGDAPRVIVGVVLIVIGVGMLASVFFTAYRASAEFTLEVNVQGGLIDVLTENSRILIELLIRVAFLAVALAAGAIVLGKGVDAIKGCPGER
jgi:hypothetical protein